VLDYGLIEERRLLSRAARSASVPIRFISRHVPEGIFQQRAVSQCSSSGFYLLLLFLGLFPLAFSSSAVTLDIMAFGRHVFRLGTAVKSEDEDECAKDAVQEES